MAIMLTVDDRDTSSPHPDDRPPSEPVSSRRDGIAFVTWLALGVALAA
jgi:hypothetical protein